MIELLLQDPRIDPSARDNYAIGCAILHNHDKVVELLLQDFRVEPSAPNNKAIILSTEKWSNLKNVEVLIQDPRVDYHLLN